MILVVLVKKMSVLMNFLMQNANLVKLTQIVLVMSNRTDEFRELCTVAKCTRYSSEVY